MYCCPGSTRSFEFVSGCLLHYICEPLPWFWLDYVHPEDVVLVESSQRKLSLDKESCCLYRIKTKNGETRVVFNHLRILEQEGANVLVGSFVDVSRFATMSPDAARVTKA